MTVGKMTLLNAFVNQYRSIWSSGVLGCLYCESWDGIDRRAEVSAIQSYITGSGVGLDFLNKNVAPHFSASLFDIKFAGVFCHKKPIVQRTPRSLTAHPSPRPGCELGDLLVAFLLLDANGDLHYYASSLFQAKAKDKLDSLTQQYLYEKDKSFVLPSNLGGAERALPTIKKERSRALRYLLMGDHRATHQVVARRTPWSSTASVQWIEFIHKLLQGSEGLKAAPSPCGSAWDVINHDLLMMATNVPHNKPPRGNNVAAKLATGVFNNFSSSERWCANSEQEGVPTILVIAAAKEPFELPTED